MTWERLEAGWYHCTGVGAISRETARSMWHWDIGGGWVFWPTDGVPRRSYKTLRAAQRAARRCTRKGR